MALRDDIDELDDALYDWATQTYWKSKRKAPISITSVNLENGVWNYCPSIFRLQMTGTGTVTLDSMDALGNITLNVYTVTLTSATNQIGFPYAGDAAVQIRATLTGTATAKVI